MSLHMTRLAPLLVALLVLAGCGASDVSLEAAAENIESESYRQEFTMEIDFGEATDTMKGEATSSADSRNGRMTAELTSEGETSEFETLLVDGTMYMRGDGIDIPDGKEWLKTGETQPGTLPPSEFVAFLRDSEDVERVGDAIGTSAG